MTTSTESRRERELLDHALEEMDIGDARLLGVRAGECEHLVGHVEAVGDAGRADALRREDHVDPAARAEIEHDLSLAELGDGGRVAAAERRERGRVRQLAALLGGVERLAESAVLARAARVAAAAAALVAAPSRRASA